MYLSLMKRRQFLHQSAILGFSLTAGGLLVARSGMYHQDSERKIFRILKADGVDVGTLPVMRAFAGNHLDHVSPFVLLDEFGPVDVTPGSDPLRVDAHPHAGVTPTTYFLEGSGHHKDSLDYDFQIAKGDFMLFNSGRGAIHMEESGQQLAENGGLYHGFQIWLNTPSAHKFMAPTTLVHRTTDMAIIDKEEYWIQVVLGELEGAKSAIETLSPAFYYHVKTETDARLDIPTEPSNNVFIYLIKGSLELEGGRALKANELALYQRGDSKLNIYSTEASEFLVLGGEPLDEEVYSYGPFVMNNRAQIDQCMRNYQSGKMGDPDVVNR